MRVQFFFAWRGSLISSEEGLSPNEKFSKPATIWDLKVYHHSVTHHMSVSFISAKLAGADWSKTHLMATLWYNLNEFNTFLFLLLLDVGDHKRCCEEIPQLRYYLHASWRHQRNLSLFLAGGKIRETGRSLRHDYISVITLSKTNTIVCIVVYL